MSLIAGSLLFFFPVECWAQIQTGSEVFYRIDDESLFTNAPTANYRQYKPASPLYLVGKVTHYDKKSGLVTIKPAYFIYTCSKTSEIWIKTETIMIERIQKDQHSIRKTCTINDLSTTKRRADVNPFSEHVLSVLTRNNIETSTENCPIVYSKR